jgi:hypothetical protein
MILQRSTSGWRCHYLPLLGFLVGVNRIIRDDGNADKLWKCRSRLELHLLLQLGGVNDYEAVLLLLIYVHLV